MTIVMTIDDDDCDNDDTDDDDDEQCGVGDTSAVLSQSCFIANVFTDVGLMKHNDCHWVDVSTLGR